MALLSDLFERIETSASCRRKERVTVHQEAYEWVAAHVPGAYRHVLDLGGRSVNGSVRPLFPDAAAYTVLDVVAGDGVDVVADAATWTPDRLYDVVVCTEVMEHTPRWREIIGTAWAALKPGGRLVATMAGPGRPPHSAVDGGWTLHPGEHYQNIHPDELRAALAGWGDVVIDRRDRPADVRAVATRPLTGGQRGDHHRL
jgi:SAM-dependent methyltransferase